MKRVSMLLAVIVASCSSAAPAIAQTLTVVDHRAGSYPSAWWLLVMPPTLILLTGCLRVYRRRRDDWRKVEAKRAEARDMAAREQRRDRVRHPRPVDNNLRHVEKTGADGSSLAQIVRQSDRYPVVVTASPTLAAATNGK